MRKLSKNEKMRAAGGTAYDKDEPTSEKVKDVLNDGLESIGDNMDKLSEKIHKKVDHHNNK